MGRPDDGEVGNALFVAGHDAAASGADDPRIALLTQLGAALLASGSAWRIRRLAAHSGDRDVPSRGNVRREIDELLSRPAAARILVLSAGLTRTIEGPALMCAPSLGGFEEDTSVPLAWIASRLRHADDVPTAVAISIPGTRRQADSCLDALGTAAEHCVIAIDAGDPAAALRALIDALWSEATDLATGTVTPSALASYLGRRLPSAAIQPSASLRSLVSPRGLARADLSERASQREADDIDELVGAVLPGRLRIIAELGRGRFGVVYRAHQELVDREVAVKVLPARLGADAMRRFAFEIRAVGKLDHRNVVRVHHADVMRDGRMFVAMELLSGPTLEQRLARGPLPAVIARNLIRQLIAGLAAAHAAGIVHGDVSPGNIILVEASEARLVLLDFGLARLSADDATAPRGGTPAFMAPEQLRGARGDASADLYSAALIALSLVTGAPPRTPPEVAAALTSLGDDRLAAALATALASDAAARPPSAIELAAALGDAQGAIVRRPQRPPFRLAAAFSEEDRGDFHGRAQEVERLLQHVLFRRAVVYVAPSGTGKTSLLRAGLIPRLRELDLDVVYTACRAGAAADLAQAIAPGADSVPAAIAERLTTAPARRLVLIVDQVEAALIDGRDESRGEAVLEALGLPSWPVDAAIGVLWSVREEYLGRLLDRVQRLEQGVPIEHLRPLSPETAADIFTRTLAHRGITAVPELVDVLIKDLTGAAAGLAAQLGWGDAPAVFPPHLQLAGAVLHEARDGDTLDLEAYRRVGGLATILSEHLHHVLEGELGASDTAIARDVLLALVAAGRTRVACEQAELIARGMRGGAARSPATIVAVLEFLRDRGLLVAAAGRGAEPIWDLAHDSLVAQVEAWVTATDLARRRALELVRYHLRRSTPDAPSLLDVAELREVGDHIATADLAELDDEWRVRQHDVPDPASRLLALSRRAVRRRRGTLGGLALAAVAIAGGFAVRWREGQREITLRDRDIGSSELVLRAFDWDPVTLRATLTSQADLTWQLFRPLPADDDQPGAPFESDDLSSQSLSPPADAVRSDVIAARGGPAVLVIARRNRAHQACSPVIVPVRSLPGHGQSRRLSIRVPTCEATLAGMLAVPAGPFIASGPGEPPSRDQQQYGYSERDVTLPAYWLDRTEFPNGLLAVIADGLALGGRSPPIYPDADEYAHAGEPDHPVASVTWFDAAALCRLVGKRLPSGNEWQKALRGGVWLGEPGVANPSPRRNFPWGTVPDVARANVNRGDGTLAPRAIGAFPGDVGPYGHLDLLGNITEWTADRRPDGFVVLRGGNWADTTRANLAEFGAIENPRQPRASMFTFGFRCAMDGEAKPSSLAAAAAPPGSCAARDCSAPR